MTKLYFYPVGKGFTSYISIVFTSKKEALRLIKKAEKELKKK